MAQLNFANQYKRLSKNDKRASYIIVYYSIVLIIYSLSIHFYPDRFDNTWINYCNIIVSIIVLVYSIINSKADYANRASKISAALNTVKGLKRDVGRLKDQTQEKGGEELSAEFLKIKEEYDSLANSVEVRDDLDFYYTIRSLCKKYNTSAFNSKKRKETKNNLAEEQLEQFKELEGYIAENNPLMQCMHIVSLKIWHGILYCAPVLILFWGYLPAREKIISLLTH